MGLNHPDVFIGVAWCLIIYVVVFTLIKKLLNKKKKQFKRAPSKYMFLFPIAWIIAILSCIGLSGLVWAMTWISQALLDNPTVHEYGLIIIHGLWFSMPKWRYFWVVSACTILLIIINISLCVDKKRSLPISEAKSSLSTKSSVDGSWNWVIVNKKKKGKSSSKVYVSGNPTLKGRKIVVRTTSSITINVLAIINLLFVILVLIMIIIWVQFIKTTAIQ